MKFYICKLTGCIYYMKDKCLLFKPLNSEDSMYDLESEDDAGQIDLYALEEIDGNGLISKDFKSNTNFFNHILELLGHDGRF